MIREKGFDTELYLDAQVKKILERVKKFDKLYLEFGGKLRFDHHASRVLPGYEVDTKVQMLKQLGNDIEIIHCISAKDIEGRKVRRDFGLTYEDQILKDIHDLNEIGLDVTAVVISRFNNESSALNFKQKLENRSIEVWINYEIENYPNDLELVISDEGYGKPELVETKKPIIIITAPGPGSGKMGFAMSQIFQERKNGVKSGFAKFETFPIWDLSVDHPVNVAYEAATADLGDFNCVDPWHMDAYGYKATNYNRDVENFGIMRKIIDLLADPGDPLSSIQSPTDMGVNMASVGIIDDRVIKKASFDEIIRRYYRYQRDFIEGATNYDTLTRMSEIMRKVNLDPTDRAVAVGANQAMQDAKNDPSKGFQGNYTGSAIEVYKKEEKVVITGKNSPLLYSESAALLNAVKFLAGIPDEIDVLSSINIKSLMSLKENMGNSDVCLDVKEVLDTLAISSVFNPNASECLDVLPQLKGCEMHSTHIMNPGCENPLKSLGVNLTMDPRLPIQI
jgi:uncharacterized protein (UPF0371 family)